MGTPGMGGSHGRNVRGIRGRKAGEWSRIQWRILHELIDRGRAYNGQTPQTLNSNGSQAQIPQPHFPDTNGKMQMYQELFEKNSALIPLVKKF